MTLFASRNALPDDFDRIIGLIEDGKIDTRPWITHRTPFAELIGNFPSYTKPETGVIKAMVEVDETGILMIRSSVTISLVPEVRGGPFVFWDDLAAACRKAKELGFDAVEVFPPSPDASMPTRCGALLERQRPDSWPRSAPAPAGCCNACTLTSPDAEVRRTSGRTSSAASSTWPARSAPRPSSARCRAGTATASIRRRRSAYLAEALNDLGEHAGNTACRCFSSRSIATRPTSSTPSRTACVCSVAVDARTSSCWPTCST